MGDFLFFTFLGGGHECVKHWVAGKWTGLKFRMELPRDKEWMIWQFHNFRQAAVRTAPRDNHTRIGKLFFTRYVHFIAVTMTF